MNYQYFNDRKFAKYNGCKYWQDTSTTERMHRYVWEYYYGEIPKGFDVHHKDHNVDNNDISNLELLSSHDHQVLHGKEQTEETKAKKRANVDKIRDLTKAWHSSEAGYRWHKEHYESMKEKLYIKKTYKCLVCGKEFQSTKVDSKFCCNAHKSKYRRMLGLDLIVKTCPVCGKEFKTNKFRPTITCSRGCASALRKSKNDNKTAE